ncbi:hypothetical protein ACFRCG_42650 [Embleya sp. NPDC056575]|uniref:hypothetical protein n=1 Tax=unclassified Embleya TaxID=2699296 RepID=UPI0036968008
MTTEDIAARFKRETAEHEMTILYDDGLYRHLRFANPRNSEFWWELVTWPGCLAVRGDMDGERIFARQPDMFQLFRSDRGRINPCYWSTKTGGGRLSCEVYDEAVFRQVVTEHFVDAVRYGDAPRGLGRALRRDVLDWDLTDEAEARRLLEGFEFKGFEFADVWEWSFRGFDPWFLWVCHAIVRGIQMYDLHRAIPAPASPYAMGSMHGGKDGSNWVVVGTLADGSPVLCDYTSTDEDGRPLQGVELQTLRDVQTWPGLDDKPDEATA